LFSEPLPKLSADIIVVGAGVAGVTAAASLGQRGWRVLLLDPRSNCPPVLKAEKVLRDELHLLRHLALFEPLLPHSGRISELCDAYNGRIFRRNRVEQLGIPYATLVNTLRANLPPTVATKVGSVTRITRDGGTTQVQLAGGGELTARLVVLACGVSGPLLSDLGLRRRMIQKEQSVVLGFDIAPAGSRPFPFQSVTYYPPNSASCIDYLTLFNFRDTMRANLFVFRTSHDPWIREFLRAPQSLLDHALPSLPRVCGDYRITSKVEFGRADLYRTEGNMPDGVVLIGDAFQSVCPSTGLGLRKAFTDVDVLAECVPAWFSTPGMSAQKLASFYEHPRKLSIDAHALQNALHRRSVAIGSSLRWQLHRALLHLKWNLLRPRPLRPRPQSRNSGKELMRGLNRLGAAKR
jgi:2-polyprenyl-6-methoxyphenol hydroxylase-like FAD-dependent oxidoreductase